MVITDDSDSDLCCVSNEWLAVVICVVLVIVIITYRY